VFGIGGVVLGLLLYAVLAGPIARMMPASWLWPERMATRVLGESDQWDAGQRLMQRASPQSWHLIVVAAPLADGNRQEIEKCSAAATKAKKPVRCAIEVKPVIGVRLQACAGASQASRATACFFWSHSARSARMMAPKSRLTSATDAPS
jgi:hypothetical protein